MMDMDIDSETGEWKDSSGEPVSEFGADSSTAPVIENSAEAIMEEHADPEWEKREKKRREIQKVYQTAMINSRQRKIAQER